MTLAKPKSGGLQRFSVFVRSFNPVANVSFVNIDLRQIFSPNYFHLSSLANPIDSNLDVRLKLDASERSDLSKSFAYIKLSNLRPLVIKSKCPSRRLHRQFTQIAVQ